MKSVETVSVASIGDIAYTMTNKKKLKKIHMVMLLIGIPFSVFQWTSIILWLTKGIWQPFLVWVIAVIPYILLFSRWYFRKTAYICPQCHSVFQPSIKEGGWARHTYSTRKLTCPSCGHHGFCVEVISGLDLPDCVGPAPIGVLTGLPFMICVMILFVKSVKPEE